MRQDESPASFFVSAVNIKWKINGNNIFQNKCNGNIIEINITWILKNGNKCIIMEQEEGHWK